MNDETRDIASVEELRTYFKELLAQYVTLKSNTQFCRSIKETFGYVPEGDQSNNGSIPAARSVNDESQQLEYSLADVSHMEISKEAHYEDLIEDLEAKIKQENEKIANLCQELNDMIILANKKEYNSKTRNINDLEKKYVALDAELAQVSSDQAEQSHLIELKQLLESQFEQLQARAQLLDSQVEQYTMKNHDENELKQKQKEEQTKRLECLKKLTTRF